MVLTQYIRKSFENTCNKYANSKKDSTETVYLAIGKFDDKWLDFNLLHDIFNRLSQNQKNLLYRKIWELAKMHNPSIDGPNWGEIHLFDNLHRLANAMFRLGFFNEEEILNNNNTNQKLSSSTSSTSSSSLSNSSSSLPSSLSSSSSSIQNYQQNNNNNNLYKFEILGFKFGEGGLGSQYMSLGEKIGIDPIPGIIGYVNGMGICNFHHAGYDIKHFSEKIADGNNIHAVYHATHQKQCNKDIGGMLADVFRMSAVNAGSYTRTAYLIVQQWIDYLDANPSRFFLWVCVSEGGAHTNSALRLLKQCGRSDLFCRVRVLGLCPAYYIMPSDYSPDLQILHFVKLEDGIVHNSFISNDHLVGKSRHIIIVPHTQRGYNPHNQTSNDFTKAVRPYVLQFMLNGSLYPDNFEPDPILPK